MRKLLGRLTFILIIVCLLLSFTNYYYEKHIFNKEAYLADLEQIIEEKPEFLVLGDSHAEYAFRFSTSSLFGIGADASDSLMESYIKLKYLIDHGYTPQYLLLEADATVFAPYRWRNNNHESSFLISSSQLINKLYKSSYSNYEVFVYSKFPILNSAVRQTTLKAFILSLFKKVGNDSSTSWNSLSSSERAEIARSRVIEQFGSSGLDRELAEFFRAVVEIAKSNDVEVIAIRYPLTNEYLEALEEIEDYAYNLLLSMNIRYLDFSTVFINRHDLFQDSDHLNKAGSEEFIKILNDELSNLEVP